MSYFFYAIQPHSGYPIFQVNKHIGYDEDEGYGIDGSLLSRELFELDSQDGNKWYWDGDTKVWIKKPQLITIYVNSLGGDVSQGFDIFNAILNCKCKVKVVIQGFAYSTAGWCFLSADEIVIYDYSSWMCHLPYNPLNPDNKSDFLDKVADSIATILSEHSGKGGAEKKTKETVLALMQTKTYFSGEQMKNEGYADEFITSSTKILEESRVFNLEKDKQKFFNKFLAKEKVINEQNHNTMAFEKVINRLKLAEGSGEDSVISAIARIENDYNALNLEKDKVANQLKVVNEEKAELERRMKEMQTKNEEMTSASDKMKNELDEANNFITKLNATNKELAEKVENAEKAEKEAKLAEAKVKAKNLVGKAYEAGKIAHNMIPKWEERAVSNYDDVEFDLENMPVNMHVPVPVNLEGEQETPEMPKPGTMAYYKAQNKIKNAEARKKWEEDVDKFWKGTTN